MANGIVVTAFYQCAIIGDGQSFDNPFRAAIADVPGFTHSVIGFPATVDGKPATTTLLVSATGDPSLLIGNINIVAVASPP